MNPALKPDMEPPSSSPRAGVKGDLCAVCALLFSNFREQTPQVRCLLSAPCTYVTLLLLTASFTRRKFVTHQGLVTPSPTAYGIGGGGEGKWRSCEPGSSGAAVCPGHAVRRETRREKKAEMPLQDWQLWEAKRARGLLLWVLHLPDTQLSSFQAGFLKK